MMVLLHGFFKSRELCDRAAAEDNFSVFYLWRKHHGGEIVAARRP